MNTVNPRFVLDVHLGKLAAHLRLLGFDARYSNHYSQKDIGELAAGEHRIILTRSSGLLKRYKEQPGFKILSADPNEQIAELLVHFGLKDKANPFSRCLVCNGKLVHVSKESVISCLPPKAILYFSEFYKCIDCCRVYWKGSHYDRMLAFVKQLV